MDGQLFDQCHAEQPRPPGNDEENEDKVDHTRREQDGRGQVIHPAHKAIEVLPDEEDCDIEDALASDEVHDVLQRECVTGLHIATENK